MSRRKHNTFSPVEIKVRLVRKGLTVTKLAKLINRPRPTVSASISQANTRFPRVREQVLEVLR